MQFTYYTGLFSRSGPRALSKGPAYLGICGAGGAPAGIHSPVPAAVRASQLFPQPYALQEAEQCRAVAVPPRDANAEHLSSICQLTVARGPDTHCQPHLGHPPGRTVCANANHHWELGGEARQGDATNGHTKNLSLSCTRSRNHGRLPP